MARPKNKRDYKAEYARRIARGTQHGLTRSQARGHPRHHEPYHSELVKVRPWEPELEEGLKLIREGESLSSAARATHVAPERLRSYVTRTGVAYKERSRWRIGQDDRRRQFPIYSNGREVVVVLRGYDDAKRAGDYMCAVGRFLDTNDPLALAPFMGASVTDEKGVVYPLETEPNTLYRLSETQAESFEDVYRILAA